MNKSFNLRSNFDPQLLFALFVKNSSCSSKSMRNKVQDNNLLVCIHSLRNASKWGHTRKMEQLESSGSPTLYLQDTQLKLCCNIIKLNRTLVFGYFGIGKQEVMEASSAELWKLFKIRWQNQPNLSHHSNRRIWLQGTRDQGWPSGSLQPGFSNKTLGR